MQTETRPKQAISIESKIPWQRVGWAATVVGLGCSAIAIGGSSLLYRTAHLIVDDATINSRVVRLGSPIDGQVAEFFARPGISVKAGQVLARIDRSHDDARVLVQMEETVRAKVSQLEAAKQLLALLEGNLEDLTNATEAVWSVDTDLAERELNQRRADVEAAIARANAARLEYERHRFLLQEGAIAAVIVDRLKADWDVARARVEQAREALRLAETSLQATRERIVMDRTSTWGNQRVEAIASLQQQIQSQRATIGVLETELKSARRELENAQSLYSERQDLEITAPIDGIVYQTDREQNELVGRSESVLALLDCNDLWVEAVIPSEWINQIDGQKTVAVELQTHAEVVQGEVSLMQPINSSAVGNLTQQGQQVQALQPRIPPQWADRSLTRLVIDIPPPPNHDQGQQFCGVGQSARLTFTKRSTWQSGVREVFQSLLPRG